MPSAYYRIMRRLIYPPFLRKVETLDGGEYLPRSGGYIVAMNHVDWLDGFYLAAVIDRLRGRPTFFLTKSRNYWWTTLALPIPADRDAIVDTAARYLRGGRVIANFPEGARNIDNRLLPGKTGTVRMAVAAGVPVVPAGITCDPGKSMAQSLHHLFFTGHHVRLHFGPPLRFTPPPGGISTKFLHDSTATLMKAIAPLAGKHIS